MIYIALRRGKGVHRKKTKSLRPQEIVNPSLYILRLLLQTHSKLKKKQTQKRLNWFHNPSTHTFKKRGKKTIFLILLQTYIFHVKRQQLNNINSKCKMSCIVFLFYIVLLV